MLDSASMHNSERALLLLSLLVLPGCDHEDGHSHGSTGEVLELLSNADATRGELRFMETCARTECHGSDGGGGGGPPLEIVLRTHDETELAAVIRNGEGGMPPQSPLLTDSAIADVMVYIRGRWPE